MKDQIIKLREEGKNYDEIKKILNCSKGTISYHLNSDVKSRAQIRQRKTKKDRMISLKLEFGGKCKLCNYSRCIEALDFHHIDTNDKNDLVSRLVSSGGIEFARKEAKKCILVCSNCHREIHNNIIKL